MTTDDHPVSNSQSPVLTLSSEDFRRLGYRAVDLAADYLTNARSSPVFSPMSEAARQVLLEQALPQKEGDPSKIVDFFQDHVFPYPMGNGHPRFFGWVNSPPAHLSVVAELLAAAMDPSCAGGDHAAIYLEHCVTRWLLELVGFPVEGSMGLLVSGGSMATLTCLAAARYWAAKKMGWNVREEGLFNHVPLIIYLSEEGHSCIRKSAELLGLGVAGLHVIPTKEDLTIDVEKLRVAIAEDRATGKQPFCIVASAGTVNTGAIDPFDVLADLCGEEQLWLHVDGAYGAVGILDNRLAGRYRGMERAQSLALDPHKWLSIPYECGCAIVRDGTNLRNTFSLIPAYLRTEEGKGFGGLPWFSEYGFQQTRGFRALKLWMALQHAGRKGLETLITRHNDLAQYLAGLVDAASDMERLAPVDLSIVCFRSIPAILQADESRLDALNKYIMEEIQSGGEAFVTGTTLSGHFALRACILHYETKEDDLAALLSLVRKIGTQFI
ncbi:MAG: amino acid decarboxylase [Ktedonobacteraceae bacterium]|nr:amino acid decarboxylase [Ktedonobacteraceae bacterium]